MAAFTNELGRYYERGKCLNKDMKGDIVDYILTNGGDSTTGYFPGNWTEVGKSYKVQGKTVKDIWEHFVTNGSVSPRKRISGNP